MAEGVWGHPFRHDSPVGCPHDPDVRLTNTHLAGPMQQKRTKRCVVRRVIGPERRFSFVSAVKTA